MAGSEAAPEGSVNSSLCALVKDKEGPVLNMLNKRLRALRKKYNRILQIEESKSQGKPINKEQEDVLKSKTSVTILIDEYEKLKQPLSAAVKEELQEREKELVEQISAAAATKERDADVDVDICAEESKESKDVQESSAAPSPSSPCDGAVSLSEEAIAEVLKVLYFGNLFHVLSQNEFVSSTWTKVHERSSCLSYDYVTDDATMPLREEDLNALAHFGSLMTSRPPNATLSHKSALENCLHHAKLWLFNSHHPLDSDQTSLSYADLRERLNRILSSEYFTMTPELQTLSEQTAAAAGQYVSQSQVQVVVHEDRAEGHINMYQTEAVPVASYYPQQVQDQSGEEEKLCQTEELNATPVDVCAEDSLDSVGKVNHSVAYVEQNETSFQRTQSGKNHISANIAFEQHEIEPLPSQSQVPQQNEQQSVHQGHEQLDMEAIDHQGQLEQEHRENQQQTQYYSQNGGPSRGYQGQRGGRGMGYGGGRGRGYMNGRGRSGRGGGYSSARGQYYDQGNNYRRNFNSGRGRGRRSFEMVYNNHADGPPQNSGVAQTN